MQDFYLNYSFNPIFENGKIAGLFGPLQNVTSEVLSVQKLHQSGGLFITVADTGERIPRADRYKIFEPFYTSKGMLGTGLGLWVSADIVRRHGGALRFRSSQEKGRNGTLFSLFLPFDAVSR